LGADEVEKSLVLAFFGKGSALNLTLNGQYVVFH